MFVGIWGYLVWGLLSPLSQGSAAIGATAASIVVATVPPGCSCMSVGPWDGGVGLVGRFGRVGIGGASMHCGSATVVVAAANSGDATGGRRATGATNA